MGLAASLILRLIFKKYTWVAVGLLFLASGLLPLGGYHVEGGGGISEGPLELYGTHRMILYSNRSITALFQRQLGQGKGVVSLIMLTSGLLFPPYFTCKTLITGLNC
jgi:4-hydroxybenzoate polyprenyltransferase